MFVRIQSADRLAKALASANSALTAKTDVNPILAAMLLEAGGEELAITVVDTTSHQLRLVVPAEVNLPGSTMLPGDFFTKIIARLGNHPINIKLEGHQLHAQAGASDTHKFDLTQGEAADFPLEHTMPPIVGVVDGDGLNEALKHILKSATEQEQEIIFHGDDGTMAIYTSHWLSSRSRFQMMELAQPFTFAVKKSALAGGRLPQWTGRVNIHWEEGKVAFSQGTEHLFIRMQPSEIDIEALDALLSTEPIGHLVVSRQTLAQRVYTIAVGKGACVVKTKGKTDQVLVITSEAAGVGGSRMEIPIHGHVRGSVPVVRFDVNLLEKALGTVDGDDLRMDFVDYVGDGQTISLRIANEGNPEKRQTLILPLQETQQ